MKFSFKKGRHQIALDADLHSKLLNLVSYDRSINESFPPLLSLSPCCLIYTIRGVSYGLYGGIDPGLRNTHLSTLNALVFTENSLTWCATALRSRPAKKAANGGKLFIFC